MKSNNKIILTSGTYNLFNIPVIIKHKNTNNDKLKSATSYRTDGETYYTKIIDKKHLSKDKKIFPSKISEYVLFGYEYSNEKSDDIFYGIYTGKTEDLLPILLRDEWFEKDAELIEVSINPKKDLVILFADNLNCNGNRLITEQIIITDTPISIKSTRKISNFEIKKAMELCKEIPYKNNN